jgi:hypothetical protein
MEAVPKASRQIGAPGACRGATEEEAVTPAKLLPAGGDEAVRYQSGTRARLGRLSPMVALARITGKRSALSALSGFSAFSAFSALWRWTTLDDSKLANIRYRLGGDAFALMPRRAARDVDVAMIR